MTDEDVEVEAPRWTPERKRLLVRLAGALAVAVLFADLISGAALFARLPAWSPAWLAWSPASAWATLAFVVFLALSAIPAFADEQPLPVWVGLHASVAAFALYEYSNIDWTLVAVDASAATGGLPGPAVLLAVAAPLFVALAAHAAEERIRFAERAAEKALPAEEARTLPDAVWPTAGRTALLALGLWVLVALGFFALVAAAPFVRPLVATAPALVPVLAAALVLATLALAARRARGGGA